MLQSMGSQRVIQDLTEQQRQHLQEIILSVGDTLSRGHPFIFRTDIRKLHTQKKIQWSVNTTEIFPSLCGIKHLFDSLFMSIL